jgi:hypothetical protein
MKKILFLSTIALFAITACGGNESAYNEQEKTSQDSIDKNTQEDDFESLMADTTQKGSVSTKPEKAEISKPGSEIVFPSK